MLKVARTNQIRQIKAASRALFGDDEQAMRDCYEQVTSERSCSAMTDAQLRQLGDYLAKATGHNSTRKIALRPNCSIDLAERLERAAGWPVPTGWRLHPLGTRKVWLTHTGRRDACPFEHLDLGDQLRLYKAVLAIYRKCGVERPAEEAELRRALTGSEGEAKSPKARRKPRAAQGPALRLADEADFGSLPV
jgi:hypothetical protein